MVCGVGAWLRKFRGWVGDLLVREGWCGIDDWMEGWEDGGKRRGGEGMERRKAQVIYQMEGFEVLECNVIVLRMNTLFLNIQRDFYIQLHFYIQDFTSPPTFLLLLLLMSIPISIHLPTTSTISHLTHPPQTPTPTLLRTASTHAVISPNPAS